MFSNYAFAQSFKVDTLQYQGVGKQIVNLVIMGDGYTVDELQYFEEDAKRFTAYFFQTEPFRQYANYFNVFAIHTISAESGAIHACTAVDCPETHHGKDNLPLRFNKFPKRISVPMVHPNTIFGSSFDNGGIHRLVVPQNVAKIEEVLKTHLPNYTQVVLLVNSPFYGGSGGKYATATVNFDSNDIAVHEIGHSFALLADEYWAGNQYAYEGPNRTQVADPERVIWKDWIGVNDIGVYAYGGKDSRANWFRPHEFCKMQYLVAPFCNVCQEIFIETIHRKSNPIVHALPESTAILEASTVKKVALKLLKPSPNTLQVRWYLNDHLIASNIDSIFLNQGIFKEGINRLKADVRDTTDLVRNPKYANFTYSKEWQINASQSYPLAEVMFTWGDTVETCFDGYQALSIKNPSAGVTYQWFEDEKDEKPFFIGSNWVTPRLKKDKIYYVSSSFMGKQSPKKAIYIQVLPAIARPSNIAIATADGKYRISVAEDIMERYHLVWYLSAATQTAGRRGSTFTIAIKDAPTTIYVELVDKRTTCRSERFAVQL